MSGSISRRLLTGSALMAFLFLGLAGVSLEQAHRDSTKRAIQDQLQAHIYLLLATAEEDTAGRPRLPAVLSAPGFNRPDSGLYAQVSGTSDGYQWRSASLLANAFPPLPRLAPGETRFSHKQGLLILQQGIGWEDLEGKSLPYEFAVALDDTSLTAQQAVFRTTLWSWLGGIGVVLLLVQVIVTRWGLQPILRIANAVRNIEQGAQNQLTGPVPRELTPLTDNLNSLIRQTQNRQERLRNALADLAHSLKTPLAVLRGTAREQANPELARQIDEQTGRIDLIVSYQRQRLAVAGTSALLSPQPLRPILERICNSLLKVHSDRNLRCKLSIADDFTVRADKGDLFELFGNLLENACKYGKQAIVVRDDGPVVVVEDDGPGIEPNTFQKLLKRGQRGDQQQPGHGIGLAVVQEIVEQYEGSLEIARSSLGGAAIRVQLEPPVP